MTNQQLKEKYYSEKLVRWYDNMADYANWLEDELIEALHQPPVSWRSEQLACIHNLEQLRLIGGNITCLDCQSTWVRKAN